MRKTIVLIFLLSINYSLISQNEQKLARIVSVIAKNHQKDSSEIKLDLSEKAINKLDFAHNYLQFSFQNTANPSNKSFIYKLEGLDYSWTRCDSCSNIKYANLDGGDYTFKVKTVEPNDQPTAVSFTLDGNIWFKWWFIPMLFIYILAFFGIAVYFFVLYKFRQKLLEQRHIHLHKMASMSELTSGIAHEIQNPLNFVNNFSELSLEMSQELITEIEKKDMDKELVFDITNDILSNQKRINEHGKRASEIVNRMIEHSKAISGNFEMTDLIKMFADQIENVKQQNSDIEINIQLNVEGEIPKIKVIPQEVNKVFQNLLSNAIFAINEKQKQLKSGDTIYTAEIIVIVKKANNYLVIKVIDNGIGISEATKIKIFQPFFTTKPTGQGTGLGLSLAYDIVTKGHGGTIECESVEGEGTTFLVHLPIYAI